MDPKLRKIITKEAGVYFIVTDSSQVSEVADDPKLRLYFINSESGPFNSLVKFAQGDTDSFTAVFGKSTRSLEKKGNFSHRVCLDSLSAGPIGVVNLRKFDDLRDVTNVATINPNTLMLSYVKEDSVPLTSLYNKNGFWSAKSGNITDKYFPTSYLNFGNVGNKDVSLFVTKSKSTEVLEKTNEGENTLEETELEIDEYPGLNWNALLKDTFVTVWVFNNTFSDWATNSSYSYLFDVNGNLTQENLEKLSLLGASGFYGKYVGSVIPNLVNETGESISIDDILYQSHLLNGIICDINTDLLESNLVNVGIIDLFGSATFTELSEGKFKLPLSYVDKTLKEYNNGAPIPLTPLTLTDIGVPVVDTDTDTIIYESNKISSNKFSGLKENGVLIGDFVLGETGFVRVTNIDEISTGTTPITITADWNFKNISYGDNTYFLTADENIMKSVDGENWEVINDIPASLTYNAGVFGLKQVCLGVKDGLNYVAKRESSIYWTVNQIGDLSTGPLTNLIYGNGRYVAWNNLMVYISSDGGNTWQGMINTFLTDKTITNCVFLNQFLAFLAIIPSTNELLYSPDFVNWSVVDLLTIEDNVLAVSNSGSDLVVFTDDDIYTMTFTSGVVSDITSVTGDTGHNIRKDGVSALSVNMLTIADIVGIHGKQYIGINSTATFIASLDTTTYTEVEVADGLTYLQNAGNKTFAVANELEDYNLVTGTGALTTLTPFVFSQVVIVNYTLCHYTTDGSVLFEEVGDATTIMKVLPAVNSDIIPLKHYTLESYKPVEEQFINGTSVRQSEILDIMNTPGIVKGLKDTNGLRYVIDCFKSYIENGYKYQFGQLMYTLDERNKFVRAILNEPFITDFLKSTNPLYKNSPSDDILNYEYIPIGGNPQYSTKLVDKFSIGSDMCFFYGVGDIINNVVTPLAGKISNLFYNKTLPFDIVANTTGYVAATELEEKVDDNDRKYLELFRFNPIVDFNGITIMGNLTGQKKASKQQQIHNSELLAYIKYNLLILAKPDVLSKGGTYNDYLRTQTEVQAFMSGLVLSNAIESGFLVKCDPENNTPEISNYKIKLVKVEYTPYNATEKVVFDLNIL